MKKIKQPKSVKVVVKNCPSLTSLKITPERVVPIAEHRIGDLVLVQMYLQQMSNEAERMSNKLEYYSRKIAEIVAELNHRRPPKK